MRGRSDDLFDDRVGLGFEESTLFCLQTRVNERKHFSYTCRLVCVVLEHRSLCRLSSGGSLLRCLSGSLLRLEAPAILAGRKGLRKAKDGGKMADGPLPAPTNHGKFLTLDSTHRSFHSAKKLLIPVPCSRTPLPSVCYFVEHHDIPGESTWIRSGGGGGYR